MTIEPAEPSGNPRISFPVKTFRPILRWQTNCNTRFKVWFGNDSSFRNQNYSFRIENPNGDEGTISKTLKPQEWMRIKMLVKNKTGSTIYWDIESWDELGRYARTDVMSFVLTD